MGQWKQGICGCFANPGLSLIQCCVAPLAIAKNSEAVGEAAPVAWILSVSGCPCIAGALLRGMIRKKSGIDGSFWMDCLLWCCIPCLALCQESAQLQSMDYLMTPELQEMNRQVDNVNWFLCEWLNILLKVIHFSVFRIILST